MTTTPDHETSDRADAHGETGLATRGRRLRTRGLGLRLAAMGLVLWAASILLWSWSIGPDGRSQLILATVAFVPCAMTLTWMSALRQREGRATAAARLAERQLSEALLSGVGEAVVVTGISGRIRRQNRGAELTFGFPTDVALGSPCHEVLGLRVDLAELDCTNGCPLLKDGDTTGADHEVWRLLPSGQRQPLLVTATPLTFADGSAVEVMHSFRDVTELKKAEAAKTTFLAAASHELKTPLTVIRGFAELLDHPEADDALRRRATATIKARALEMGGIVERLLLAARVEDGSISAPLDQVDIVRRVERRVLAFATTTGVDIDLSIPNDCPTVLTSATALDTIVDHLVENAVKFSPDGTPVSVSIHFDEQWVSLSVLDHGIGMSERQIQQCFERFWQAESSDTRRFRGTGIGLYIVKALADVMLANLQVESHLGQGSCFTLAMPRETLTALTDAADQRSPAQEVARRAPPLWGQGATASRR